MEQMNHNSVLDYWRNRGHRLPDLKACPLCGSEAALSDDSELVHQTNPEADAGAFFCSCPSCGLTDGSYRTPEQAVEHWNRRMTDRRHGYWMPRLRTDPTKCRCSICHVVSWAVASGQDDGHVCRHCGAIMDVPDPYMVTDAYLMTAEDFQENPEVDRCGNLPAYQEFKVPFGEPDAGRWTLVDVNTVQYGRQDVRYWNERPTDDQRADYPWGDEV